MKSLLRVSLRVFEIKPILIAVTAVTSAILATGCGVGKNQQFNKAPKSEKEVGVSVSGLRAAQVEKILKENPNIQVRKINVTHGIYEFRGVTPSELIDIIADPKVVVEANTFNSGLSSNLKKFKQLELDLQKLVDDSKPKFKLVKKNSLATLIEKSFRVQLNSESVDFLDTCNLNVSTAPNLVVASNIEVSSHNDYVALELGQAVRMNTTQSTPKSGNKELQNFWILAPPSDSNLTPIVNRSDKMEFMPDTSGIHFMAMLVKDSEKNCKMGFMQLYVTANEKFSPKMVIPRSQAKKINKNIFWHLFHVESESTWEKATGEGILIAIIDSGANYNHPALAENIYVKTSEIPDNGLDDDENGLVDDSNGYDFFNDDAFPFDDVGHGSHVAGIAASPIFGAAKNAQILPVKAGSEMGYDSATIAGAIYYSVDEGANIINMSIGGAADSALIREAVSYAERSNVLIVTSSGNDGKDNTINQFFPSNIQSPNLISVGAVDEKNQLTEYSNFGTLVPIAAPGGTLEQPIVSAYKSNPKNELFAGQIGTSMASPLVAGAAAQIWSAKPTLTAAQVKTLLLDNGKSVAGLDSKISTGRVLDVTRALAKILPEIELEQTGLASSRLSL